MARTKQHLRTIPTLAPLSPPPPGTACIERKGSSAVAYHIPTTPTPLPHNVSASSSSSTPNPSTTTQPLKTTIHLPTHSTWTSGLHYHTTHTEYLRLVRGCIFVRVGSSTRTLSAAAGGTVNQDGTLLSAGLVVEVPKYARHNWGRAQHYHASTYRVSTSPQRAPARPADWEDDVVVEEWTAPSDLSKPLFFWNLNGVITDSAPKPRWMVGTWWVPFQLFVIFWELDNWPVFVDLGGMLEPWMGWHVVRNVERGVEHVVVWMILFTVGVLARVVSVQAVEEKRTPKELWEAWLREKGIGMTKKER